MKYWVETLGCPKNQVDSDKLIGTLGADGHGPADGVAGADLVVINTCAFIESARQESIDTILAAADARRPGARLVVTGCMAERYGSELAELLPEVDQVAGFGVPVSPPVSPSTVPVALGRTRAPGASFDLLNLPRPAASAPWAYLKVAEGCDRACGFCAIPSFRGKQRSRQPDELLAEVDALGAKEIVLVAQDLASYGRDIGRSGAIVELVEAVAARVDRVRLLYLYPSQLTPRLVDAIGATGCAYFDLSLQHVSRPHLARMRRWGEGPRFVERIHRIREAMPEAAFRSSFIVGYPGETEEDHDQLLEFLAEAQLDWAGFFPFSLEEGTYAAGLDDHVDPQLMADRLAECHELQDGITSARRRALVGQEVRVLVDGPGVGRSHREAPEIDGVINVPETLPVGEWADVLVTGAEGPDLEAVAVPVGVS
ncbi:MAG TPA: 30S ribosomal protein S12 methylthiotransferase RimO [Acidimicrobiales bacterium]|nr:30S ribosomal protein S12 methylthiotransferase RimO [Acidimicrobiales bacterium]